MDRIAQFFRHLFVPHRGNGHRPHILRSPAVSAILAVVLIVQIAAVMEVFVLHEGGGYLAAIISSVLVDLTNQARASEHIGTLTVNPLLVAAAQAKANDMVTRGYFEHISPDGLTPWHWFDLAGYRYEYAGENLAVNFSDSSDVVSAWMASPEHRANIEKPNYTDIGIASAPGMYEGKSAIYVVQMFGSPARALPAQSAPPSGESFPAPSADTVNLAGKVLAAEAQKPAAQAAFAAAPVQKIQAAIPVAATPEKPAAYSEIQKLALRPGAVSRLALEFATGLFAAALLAAVFIRKHLIHKETLRNGVLALAVLALAIFLHGSFFSPGAELPASSAGASIIGSLQ